MKRKAMTCVLFLALFSVVLSTCVSGEPDEWIALTIQSVYVQGEISLDGKKDQDWDSATAFTFTVFEFENEEIERDLTIATIYNDTHIFFWVSVNETELGGEIMLIFKTNTSGPILIEQTIPTWRDGNDVKQLTSENDTYDEFIYDDGLELDINYEGSTDIEGKCWTRSGGFDFELAFPLSSNDTNGHDISLTPGDQILLFPYYSSDGEFTLIRSTYGMWSNILVYVGDEIEPDPNIPSYSIPILIVSMLAVSALLIFKNKQKF